MAASSRSAGGKTRLASAKDLEPFLIEAFPCAATESMEGGICGYAPKGKRFRALERIGIFRIRIDARSRERSQES